MNDLQLKYFITAAQSQNFSDAARRYFITQPALSHQISALEDEIGIHLFVRTGKQVKLTSAGRLFLPEAVEILNRIEASKTGLWQHVAGETGKLSMALVNNTNQSVFIRSMSSFSERYPNVQITISVLPTAELNVAMSEGYYDFYFTSMSSVENNPQLEYIITNQDRLCFVLPEHHHLASKPLDISLLANERFLSISDATSSFFPLHRQINNVCAARGYFPKTINCYNGMAAILLAVSAGLGISIVPEETALCMSNPKVARLTIPGEDCVITSVIAWRKDNGNLTSNLFKNILYNIFETNNELNEQE